MPPTTRISARHSPRSGRGRRVAPGPGGKKVSKAAAKGGRDYAYYRCIGTDAHRFGGERMCDNTQVRMQRLDDLIWQEVVAQLSDPARLKREYEPRLDMLEQDEKATADTAALEKQKRHLQTSKARLIDSYTEGVIEKHDFDPKMQQLKVKLQQIDRQIATSKEHAAGQFELFLVINRLEEFAAAVNDRLSTMDFTTKREIIRALVKRIEIHKDEIVVVFRVDPDPGLQSGDLISKKCQPGSRTEPPGGATRRPRPLRGEWHAEIRVVGGIS
jgi:site-specific DNA recombinase